MSPEFKNIATILLEARRNGHLNDASDFFKILHSNPLPLEVSSQEMHDFIEELVPCDDPIAAQAVADKYDLIHIENEKSTTYAVVV